METPWDKVAEAGKASHEDIRFLVALLASRDGLVRQSARDCLVGIGRKAAPRLTATLRDPREQVRWEAAKALAEIADPSTADPLAEALEDVSGDVRWVAAEALITLREAGLRAVLRRLRQRPDGVWLREGAHHVAHDLAGRAPRDATAPLLAALNGWQSRETVLAAVGRAEAMLPGAPPVRAAS